jgi:hypothetical protein
MTPEITNADLIDRRAQRIWRQDQTPMSDTVADRTWGAIDEAERTRYRIEAARLPSDPRWDAYAGSPLQRRVT